MWNHSSQSVVLVLAVLAACGRAPAAAQKPASKAPTNVEAAAAMTVEQAWAALPTYKHGESRVCFAVLSHALRQTADPDRRRQFVGRLVAALEDPKTTNDAKDFILRELCIAADDSAVPALARLLPDKELSHLARAALEQTPGDAAGAALRQALSTLRGDLLVGVVTSLGRRRDAQAVRLLAPLLSTGDDVQRQATAAALGNIGTREAADVLLAARASAAPAVAPALADACLACAEALIAAGQHDAAQTLLDALYRPSEPPVLRIAALRCMARTGSDRAIALVAEALQSSDAAFQRAAAECVGDIPGAKAVDAFLAVLPKVNAQTQAVILSALGPTGSPAVVKAAAGLARSEDPAVRLAAVRALAAGDVSITPLLLETAADATGELQAAARDGLDRVGGNEASAAMLQMLPKAPARQKAELIRALAARGYAQAAPAILPLASDEADAVRLAAIKAVGELGGKELAGAVVALLAKARDDQERSALESAAVSVCRRIGDDGDAAAAPALAALATADATTKGSLLRVLTRIGGAKAQQAIIQAAGDADTAISDAAVRALAEYGDISASDELLRLAREAPRPNQRILALRGYIRLAGDKQVKDGVKRLRTALPLCSRLEEKRLVVAALGGIASIESLKFIDELLADTSVAEEACQAAVAVARATRTDPVFVQAVMKRVAGITKNANLRKQAEDQAAARKAAQ